MKNLSFVLVGVFSMSLGCTVSGDGSGGPDPDPDPVGPDAGTDPVPTGCALADSYGDLGASMGGAAVLGDQQDMPGSSVLTLGGALNQDAAPDVFQMQLWEGYGVFTGGFVTGTFDLTGAEANILDCGACVTLLGDVNTQTGQAVLGLVANGGTLTITAVDKTPTTGRVTGSISNVTLREISVDGTPPVQSEVTGGCTSSIGTLSFDVPVMAAQQTP